jgi:LysR family transcriptional regulator, nitrogen assimilation regulatory protein
MNLKQLEYFVRVCELSSFTRAAVQLGVPQPALSRYVRDLEVQLHQTLLLRNGRGATPTEAGKLLLSHARGILHQVALAKEALGASRGALAGRVAIGLPPSLSRRATVPLSLAFRRALPQAQLTLTEGFSVLMYDNLRLGNLDLALLYNPVLSPDLEQTLVHESALVCISSSHAGTAKERSVLAGKQITLEQLSQLPLLLPSRPNAFRILLEDAMQARKLKPIIAMEVDGLNAILSLVQEGLGHAVLPSYTLTSLEGLSTRAIVEPQLMSQLMMVRSALRPVTQTQQKAQELLVQALQPFL